MGEASISEYFRGRSVFVTGGTGCVGSALVEKLLRSCPDLHRIFVLIREKKGKDIKQRLDTLLNGELFARVMEESPECRDKVVPIDGDLTLPNLGISNEDQALLQEHVSVVFHSGATVRFTDTLRIATNINVAGTKRVLEFSTILPKLQSMIFVSTAFSQCKTIKAIEEKVYSSPEVDPERLIQCAEWMTDEQLKAITPLIFEEWPIAYSFTKACAEKLVDSYKNRLPVVIYRPSIVISSLNEPVPGYTSTFIGLNGMFTGGAAGVLRTSMGDKNTPAELVPLDYTVNGLIAAAWARATASSCKDGTTEVYNMVSSRNQRSWDYMVETMKRHFQEDVPLERVLWYPIWVFASSPAQSVILRTILHLLPAFILDMANKIFGKLPRLSKLYKRAHELSDITSYFMARKWNYNDSNLLALSNSLSPQDRKQFPFDMADILWPQMLYTYAHGLRKYLMKQDPSTIPESKKWISVLRWVNLCTIFLLSLVSLRLLYSFCYILMAAHDYISSEYILVK